MALGNNAINRITESRSQVGDSPTNYWQIRELLVSVGTSADQYEPGTLRIRKRHD
jgi:hypothetical protein